MALDVIFENVNYQYPKGIELSLKDINISVSGNKIIAVMGKTGSGKTTLLSTTNGLIPQFFEGKFSGRISLNGNNTTELPIQNLVQKVGLVLQDPETQIFGLTVGKDIAFGPSNLAFPKEKITKNIVQAAKVVNLETQLEKGPDQLSGGEKQRLAIAGILAIESPILVLDEPTSELDPEGVAVINETLKSLRDEENRTIIFSTHNPHSVIDNADDLWVLDDGM
ncbi:energy-coupling factor ABC transporter ATP-binding protein, partial [Calditrichota bacterium]